MIDLKKPELEKALLLISAFELKTGELVSGLMKEAISLGAKRKAKEIHKQVFEKYKEFLKEIEDTRVECGEDKERLKTELQALFEEEVKINAEKIPFSLIENIVTSSEYDFDILNKITI